MTKEEFYTMMDEHLKGLSYEELKETLDLLENDWAHDYCYHKLNEWYFCGKCKKHLKVDDCTMRKNGEHHVGLERFECYCPICNTLVGITYRKKVKK